jgi:tRNA modification GTPase
MTEVRDTLLDLLAELEAGLDFVDEDIEFISACQLDRQLAAASAAVAATALQMASRSESIDAVRVVLLGEPNVGKSSLFNALTELNPLAEKLARRDAPALVSKQPGTTRDYLTALLDLQGIACQLVDTAGIEPDRLPEEPPDRPSETISGAAQQMTTDALRRANIQLLCFDASQSTSSPRFPPLTAAGDLRQILVATKADAASEADLLRMCSGGSTVVVTSSRTGRGLNQLRTAIHEAAVSCEPGHVVTGTAVRCRDSLRLAAASLERARQNVAQGGGEELVSAEIRTALAELGKVVGAVYTDDLLDRIFSRFCIGK